MRHSHTVAITNALLLLGFLAPSVTCSPRSLEYLPEPELDGGATLTRPDGSDARTAPPERSTGIDILSRSLTINPTSGTIVAVATTLPSWRNLNEDQLTTVFLHVNGEPIVTCNTSERVRVVWDSPGLSCNPGATFWMMVPRCAFPRPLPTMVNLRVTIQNPTVGFVSSPTRVVETTQGPVPSC